jgi:hypothetical protein
MNLKQVKRYNELWQMLKSGKAIVDGKVSQKLSDLKKADYEFRISGPSCNGVTECNQCQNKNVCW